jgi:filamentous hemagglutinin
MAAPHIAEEIGQFFKQPENQGNEAGHILAHTVLGAALSAATGNNVLMGALAAGSAEAIAPILSNYLYGDWYRYFRNNFGWCNEVFPYYD